MRIPVGPLSYELRLVDDPITLDGVRRRAICDGESRHILIDSSLTPDQRIVEFWHEFGHAIKFELDIHDTETLGHEQLARLMGIGMAHVSPFELCRIQIYLTRGIEADEILMHDRHAIPVVNSSALGAVG